MIPFPGTPALANKDSINVWDFSIIGSHHIPGAVLPGAAGSLVGFATGCAENVGANACSLVAPLFWSYTLQPSTDGLVRGVRASVSPPEQHVWAHRHNQTGIV